MAYNKIKPYNFNETELKQMWHDVYCAASTIISTLDSVIVKFYPSDFDHVFFESADRKFKDKSILSLNRLEKMYWIKDVLTDTNALLKQGWDKKTKSYDNDRRVAMVKGNYVVVIRFTGFEKARFVTAYEMQENEDKVKNSPNWIKDPKYVKIV